MGNIVSKSLAKVTWQTNQSANRYRQFVLPRQAPFPGAVARPQVARHTLRSFCDRMQANMAFLGEVSAVPAEAVRLDGPQSRKRHRSHQRE